MRWSTSWGTALSFALHAGIAAGLVALPKHVTTKTTMVGVLEKKKKEDKKEPLEDNEPPPKPAPIEAPKRAPAKPKPAVENTPPQAAAPPPAAAAPAAAHAVLNALPSLGISMAGGTGPGIAVPTGPVGEGPAARPVEAARPAPRPAGDDCTEKATKPKPASGVPQPEYTSSARSAGVEGKVRVQIQVDESGAVTSAQVTSGLGYGLDEAALAVARKLRFSPAMRCGKPVAASFALSFRFETN